MNEDRTTEEERRYIMEARKRAMQKRKKLRTLGKSRSTESEDEENEEEEGRKLTDLGPRSSFILPPKRCFSRFAINESKMSQFIKKIQICSGLNDIDFMKY